MGLDQKDAKPLGQKIKTYKNNSKNIDNYNINIDNNNVNNSNNVNNNNLLIITIIVTVY